MFELSASSSCVFPKCFLNSLSLTPYSFLLPMAHHIYQKIIFTGHFFNFLVDKFANLNYYIGMKLNTIKHDGKKAAREAEKLHILRKKRLVKIHWNDLTLRKIAQIFECTPPFVTYALMEKFNSQLARAIRSYVDALPLPH